MSDSSDLEDPGEQIRIALRPSRECSDALALSSDAIAVPASIGRKGLSAVVNHLLEREDIPFEFIVGKSTKLLRTGVEKEARKLGLSLEEAIPITYFPSTDAPQAMGESERLPDWISSMDAIDQTLVTGCYDGSLYLFETKNKKSSSSLLPIQQTKAHDGPVKCVSIGKDNENQVWIASGSMDHSLKLFKDLNEYAQCHEGHSSSIGAVDIHGSGQRLASGDWDGNVCLWDFSDITEQPIKKSKGGSQLQLLSPIRFQAHGGKVSGISWGNFEKARNEAPENLFTASWDHSIKLWDVGRQDCLTTLNSSRVFSCIDTSYHSKGIVASGHPDCTIRLWDVRANNSKESSLVVSDSTFRPSHKAWVTAVKWSVNSPFHLASTSHDGTIKYWDIRSSSPLHTVRSFGEDHKAFCLVVGNSNQEQTIYVGGTDNCVKQFMVPSH